MKGDREPRHSAAEVVNEASGWIVGGGIITMALFPLALPGLALAVIAAIPLALVALVAAVVVVPVLLVRRVGRRAVRTLRPTSTIEHGRRSTAPRVSFR